MAEDSTVFKSGPLFISSKGLGWTSWKKRWFILTHTSLVFYRNDPSTSKEANLTLGGIELHSSGSVVVKADKKLITVLFPDGRDGRAFTLKAETSEDLQEWKTALENALAQAPCTSVALGQNSIFRSDTLDTIESIPEQGIEEALKSTVAGGPILLALEDNDGNPSFLEKALCFIEQYGVKIEGILRQSADVEEVKRRVKEYEQGRNEFTADEDAHLIGDCIKYVLREVPSAAVPASCCTALLEAFKSDRGARVSRMRAVIAKSFPEPNRCLLQRILKMMKIVVSHKSENRMSVSAVAACMAPLLLRPLLAGDCELDNNVDVGGDGSFQLLQAAAAANHAQAMVIILLEEYEKIFTDDYLQEDYLSSEVYSESDDDDGEDDDYDDGEGDNDEYYEGSTDNEIEEDNGYEDADDKEYADTECNPGRGTSVTSDGSGDIESDFSDEVSDSHHSGSECSEVDDEKAVANKNPRDVTYASSSQHDIGTQIIHPGTLHPSGSQNNSDLGEKKDSPSSVTETHKNSDDSMLSERLAVNNSSLLSDRKTEPMSASKLSAVWGRAPGKKLSMESIDYAVDDETAIRGLQTTKADLENRIKEEVKENELLQETLDRRKEALCERRLALQQDVHRLQEQLERERNLRASLEAGLVSVQHGLPISSSIDGKTRKDIEEIVHAEADIINLKQQVADLHGQLNQTQQKPYDSPSQSCDQHRRSFKRVSTRERKEKRVNEDEKLHGKLKPGSTSLRKVTHEDFGANPAAKCDASFARNENNLSSASCRNEKSHIEDTFLQNRQPSNRLRQKTKKFETKSLKARCNSPAGLCPAGTEVVSEDITTPKNNLLETNSRSPTVSNTQMQDSSQSQNREFPEDHQVISQIKSKCTDTNSLLKEPNLRRTNEVSQTTSNVPDGEDVSLISESRKEKSLLPEASSSPQNKQPCQNQQEKPCQIRKMATEVGASFTESPSIGALNLASLKCKKGENNVLGRNFESMKGQVLDSPPLRRRQPPRKQQPGNPNSLRSASPGNSSFAVAEPSFSGSASTKNPTRIEDAIASTSTFTKLTNKLYFLKERRVPLTNELQAMDNGRGQCTDGPATKTNFR